MDILANWDIALIAWGMVWVLVGTGLMYGLIRVIGAEDREVREAESEEALNAATAANKVAQERPKVEAA